jgi:hypothetical protein
MGFRKELQIPLLLSSVVAALVFVPFSFCPSSVKASVDMKSAKVEASTMAAWQIGRAPTRMLLLHSKP